MRIGVNTGYWQASAPPHAQDLYTLCDTLGVDSLWTSEAYGSDALTPLAWWGARTSHIRLGTAVMQMSARTPTAAAMAAITMDHLSQGRFIMGLGASGPQVVEGWYGQPYARPLARTREYISIVRDVIARQHPVEHQGHFYSLPLSPRPGSDQATTGIVGGESHSSPQSTPCAATFRCTLLLKDLKTSRLLPSCVTAGSLCFIPRNETQSSGTIYLKGSHVVTAPSVPPTRSKCQQPCPLSLPTTLTQP